MTSVFLIAGTNYGTYVCRLEGRIILRWERLDPSTPPVADDTVPRSIYEVNILTEQTAFRQVWPDLTRKLTWKERILGRLDI